MDLQTLRQRVIDEVVRQLEETARSSAPAPAAPAPAVTPAGIPADLVPSPARAAELACMQAACTTQPSAHVPEKVDVLVVLFGRDQVGDGLAEARALIHQGCSAALVTTPAILESAGPGLLYEVLAGGPTFCHGDAELAARLARAAGVVLVPVLPADLAAQLAAPAADDFPAQVLAQALQQRRPVVAAVCPNEPATWSERRRREEALQPLRARGVTLAAPARLADEALRLLGPAPGAAGAARGGPTTNGTPAAPGTGRWQPDPSKAPAWAGITIAVPGGHVPARYAAGLERPAAPGVEQRRPPGGNAVPAALRAAAQPDAPAAKAGQSAPVQPAFPPGEWDRKLARYIDHTLLKPEATAQQVEQLCAEARKYEFFSVCVNPTWVPLAVKLLQGSPVKVAAVIGFPLGATSTTAKALEARDVVAAGAAELDMVINVGALKSGQYDLVRQDIAAVVQAAGSQAIVKVILETGLLSDEEKVKACELAKEAGAHFVKTSTGFGPGGAKAEDIALMRRTVGPEMGVKASGGIRDRATAIQMIEAGANRIGASASVAIVTGAAAGGGKY